jgi:hypothetical protein
MERYRRFAASESAPHVRHTAQATHTILGSPGAPSPAQWHSENESAQAAPAALAACGDGEDLPVAGVSTSRGEGTHPYFVWTPAAQEPAPPKAAFEASASMEMSEYMQRYRRFTAEETVRLWTLAPVPVPAPRMMHGV